MGHLPFLCGRLPRNWQLSKHPHSGSQTDYVVPDSNGSLSLDFVVVNYTVSLLPFTLVNPNGSLSCPWSRSILAVLSLLSFVVANFNGFLVPFAVVNPNGSLLPLVVANSNGSLSCPLAWPI